MQYVVMGLCHGFDLGHWVEDHILKKSTLPNIAEVMSYFEQMTSSVLHCHASNVIHRDLKLENFLFSDTGIRSSLKLCDFGACVELSDGNKAMVEKALRGSRSYTAPEVFLKGEYSKVPLPATIFCKTGRCRSTGHR